MSFGLRISPALPLCDCQLMKLQRVMSQVTNGLGDEDIMDLIKKIAPLTIKRLKKKRPRQDSNLESPDS